MDINFNNINEEFEKILNVSGRETAIKWFRQRLLEIINNPASPELDKKAAEISLSIWNESYSEGLN